MNTKMLSQRKLDGFNGLAFDRATNRRKADVPVTVDRRKKDAGDKFNDFMNRTVGKIFGGGE